MAARRTLTLGLGLLLAAGATSAEVSAFGGSEPSSQYVIKHEPRLQLGDAPLVGYPGSETDQVQVLWQTVPAGGSFEDSFIVEYRASGRQAWSDVAPILQIPTGVAGRVNHYADLRGLSFGAEYEYRVRHVRAGFTYAIYPSTFRTRLPPGSTERFSFAAYGDSAQFVAPAGFRSVQARINEFAPDFALALGDNAYNDGNHTEFDARFEAARNPEAAAWGASHIDFVAFGNHDVHTAAGRPTEQNYAVPVPVAGVTAPAAPPRSEPSEHNYSFDYGSVHFLTFDTNSLGNLNRLEAVLEWVAADLAASDQPWKVVFGHHPVAGDPDKSEASPAYPYYRAVVPALLAGGADVFMVGHSHTFSWSYPLTGERGGVATFIGDEDASYRAGAGLVQVVAGVGGQGVRSGSFGRYPFLARGFSQSTDPPGELGFVLVEVSGSALTFSYIAADDGEVIASFAIRRQPARPGGRGWMGVVAV